MTNKVKEYEECIKLLEELLKEIKENNSLLGSQEVLLTSVIKMLKVKIDSKKIK